jgi:hypothetical protein
MGIINRKFIVTGSVGSVSFSGPGLALRLLTVVLID